MINARNELAHETTVQFAKWLDTDGSRDKPHNRGWAELLLWVNEKKSIQELAAMPLPFSELWEDINKELELVQFNHAPSLTEDHSTPEPKSPHEAKCRGGKKSRRGKPFRLRK